MPLDPEIIKFLERRAAAALPEIWEAPVSVLRKNLENRPALSGDPEKIYEVEHKYFAGPTAELPIRIYRPHWHKPLPALIYYCGGGWGARGPELSAFGSGGGIVKRKFKTI